MEQSPDLLLVVPIPRIGVGLRGKGMTNVMACGDGDQPHMRGGWPAIETYSSTKY